jgi:hypothetical protein
MRGVVDEAIDSTELQDTSSNNLDAVSLLLDIASYHESSSSSVANDSSGLLGVSVLIQVGDNHVGALSGERYSDSSSDTTIASGNDHDLSPQFSSSNGRLLPKVGAGAHFGVLP